MGFEKTIATVHLRDAEAITLCEGVKEILAAGGMEDMIITTQTSSGDTIKALELTEETLEDGTTLYNLILRLA